MDRFTAMQVFTEVADRSSLTETATALDMSRAMVSRYLESLETWLGVRLLHRTTRRVSLTDAGTEALEHCRQVLALTHDVQALAGQRSAAPGGRLRITSSVSFAQAWLSQVLSDFLVQYPQTQIEVVALDRAVNLVEERIDLAVRISQALDPNLIARRLTVCRSMVCASPEYLRTHPPIRRMEDLAAHNCLTHSYYGQTLWNFELDGQPSSVAVGGNLSANESTSLLQAAVAGVGVALLPSFMAAPLVHSGQLVALLPAVQQRELGIYAVYASRKNMSAALRAMLDFLAERFPPEPPWDAAAQLLLKK